MSKMQDKRQIQAKAARLQIVSRLWLRQYTYRQIREKVMEELHLKSYAIGTVKNDIDAAMKLLNARVGDNMEDARDLELHRIDEACAELWDAWEKSKRGSGLGTVAYMSEIRQQLQERRKLLGLYAPEKKEVSGGISFASFLMESDVVEDNEEQ